MAIIVCHSFYRLSVNTPLATAYVAKSKFAPGYRLVGSAWEAHRFDSAEEARSTLTYLQGRPGWCHKFEVAAV